MLILTRKVGQKIKINHDITIEVVEHFGNQIRIGITAPQNVRIHRQEIYDRIYAASLTTETAIVKDSLCAMAHSITREERALMEQITTSQIICSSFESQIVLPKMAAINAMGSA